MKTNNHIYLDDRFLHFIDLVSSTNESDSECVTMAIANAYSSEIITYSDDYIPNTVLTSLIKRFNKLEISLLKKLDLINSKVVIGVDETKKATLGFYLAKCSIYYNLTETMHYSITDNKTDMFNTGSFFTASQLKAVETNNKLFYTITKATAAILELKGPEAFGYDYN